MLFYDLFRNDPKLLKLKAGERLFRQGDAGDVMYVVTAGEAEVTASGMSIEVVKSGDIVGELALIEDTPRAATVTARSDCELAVVDKERFRYLIKESPEFAIEVMRAVAHRLRESNRRIAG